MKYIKCFPMHWLLTKTSEILKKIWSRWLSSSKNILNTLEQAEELGLWVFVCLLFIVNNLSFLNKIAWLFSSNTISIFSSCYNVVKLKAIITNVQLQEECNNRHNVTQLKCNLELCTLKGEIIQVHLYCRSNQHLLPTPLYTMWRKLHADSAMDTLTLEKKSLTLMTNVF